MSKLTKAQRDAKVKKLEDEIVSLTREAEFEVSVGETGIDVYFDGDDLYSFKIPSVRHAINLDSEELRALIKAVNCKTIKESLK